MKKQDIIDAIIGSVEGSFLSYYIEWRIGLTHDLDDRKQEHESKGRDTKKWKHWQADSLADGRAIESHFINNKHMKGGEGGNLDPAKPTYVYIF